ncbi:MAG: DNA repair protein RadC [Bacilli bacterium]
MKIKEIPKHDRPREKAIRDGIATLSDCELLAIIISSGIRGKSALEIGEELLKQVHSLKGLKNKNLLFLSTFEGLDESKALSLMSCFEIMNRIDRNKSREVVYYSEPKTIAKIFRPYFKCNDRENVMIITMNGQLKIISQKILYIGTENCANFSSTEILAEVIANSGKRFVIIHNHPSGNPSPSGEDLALTSIVKKEGEILGLFLHDHIIISDDSYFSFREKHLLI